MDDASVSGGPDLEICAFLARRWGIAFVAGVVVLAGCANRAVPATPSAVEAAPSQLTVPPFGPGLADTDRDEAIQPSHKPSPVGAGVAAPLSSSNVKLTQFTEGRESETTIAVNPANPQNIVAGAICGSPNLNCFYTSLDGGQTWTDGTLAGQSGFTTIGDPAVTFCGDGKAYYTMVAVNFSAPYRSGIFVNRSLDGGLSWPLRRTVVDRTASDLSGISDKPWITCDATTSAFAGRVYVTYTDPLLIPSGTCTGQNCRVVKVARSTDSGASWANLAMVSDDTQSAANQAVLATGPLGELYVAWDWGQDQSNSGSILFDKSTNGGVSFGVDVGAASFTGINPDPNFRRLTYPIMDVDRTNGPYRGNIYIAFSDNRNGDPDILLVRSTDGGTNWSAPIRVNDDPLHNGADQWAQGIAVDPLGRVIVTFSDRRRFIGGPQYEEWGAISRDGGLTFDTNFLIADTPSDASIFPGFLGDYDSVAATSTRLYPTWADLRPGSIDPDIYSDAYLNTFRYDEVKGVLWNNATDLAFTTQDARFGVNLDYDVTGGLLSELRADHAFARAACVAPAWPAPPVVDARVPPVGDGYYYLVRVHGPAGAGTYGDAYPPARPNARDALDETLITCP